MESDPDRILDDVFDVPKKYSNLRAKSKIIQYGLAEKVTYWAFTEKRTLKEIAALCNKDLEQRNDGKEYVEISSINVQIFVNQERKEQTDEVKDLMKSGQVGDVMDELKVLIIALKEKFWTMFEKENVGKTGTSDFVRLHNALHEDIKLLANLQGKLRSYITFDTLAENIMRIIDIVESDKELSNRDKKRLIYKIRDVLTIEGIADTKVVDNFQNETKEVDPKFLDCEKPDCEKQADE